MKKNKAIYFVGIGGIGMSALARYFLHEGYAVGGYDRTPSDLTRALQAEGAEINFEDDISLIGEQFLSSEICEVVYTPAIPATHSQLQYFQNSGFRVVKRSEMLGLLARGKYAMAVAGTHGKSSTSTLIAWLNHCLETNGGCAVLGAISKNFDSNLVLGEGKRIALEADEYDRSFLRLSPDIAVITSVDADHLDIYGTYEAVREAFSQFVELIKPGGCLILKQDVEIELRNPQIEVLTYSLSDEKSDFYASQMQLQDDGRYCFTINTPDGAIENCVLGILGWVNVENAVAAVASLFCAAKKEGKTLDLDALRLALEEFRGIKRRMELYHSSTKHGVYIDDYAHHPREISATLSSVREIFPGRGICAIFQPHLFSRTKDLYKGFAEALSLADQVVLLPIYPAREEPIEGVCSQMIARELPEQKGGQIINPDELVAWCEANAEPIIITFGAGDIDLLCPAMAKMVNARSLTLDNS